MLAILSLLALAFSQQLPIPASELCNVGFDYRNGTWNPTVDAKASAIFKFNFDKQKTYASPEAPEIVWTVPDEMDISTRLSSFYNTYEGAFMHFSYVQKISITSWHIGIGFSYDNFGIDADYSQEMGKIEEWCKFNSNYIYLSNILYTLYYAEPFSYLFLDFSSMFQLFIDNMPRQVKTEKDKKILKEFVLKYGTHFPEDGHFGGRNHFDAKASQTYTNHTTIKWCSQQFKLNFYFSTWNLTIGGGFFRNKSEIHIDETFAKEATTEMFFEGGFVKYQTNSTLGEWKDSLFHTQAMTNGTLTEMWDLVDDQQKAKVLKDAITHYIKTGSVTMDAFNDDRVNGHDILSSGFDAVRGKGRFDVFEFGGVNQMGVPEGIEMRVGNERPESEVEVKVYNDVVNRAKEYSKEKIVGAEIIESREVYNFYKNYFKRSGSQVKASKQYHSYYLFLDYSRLKHSRLFTNAVDDLPLDYDDVKYYNFIKTFGTHYVTKVSMGGEIKMDTWVTSKDVSDSVKDITKNLFNERVMNGNAIHDGYDFFAAGGLDEDVKDWETFKGQLKGNEVVLKKYLAPLYELIPNETIKENVKFAIQQYTVLGETRVKKVLRHLA